MMAAAHAACATPGVDPEMWFDDRGPGFRDSVAVAKSICRTCPVRLACLEHAIAYERGAHPKARHGIFGGLTPSERYLLDVGPKRRRGQRGQVAA